MAEVKLPISAFSRFLSLFVDSKADVCSLRGCVKRLDLYTTRPHANGGPTASIALFIYIDGVSSLNSDPFAAYAALCSLCCPFF
jgi:hypothetical protein